MVADQNDIVLPKISTTVPPPTTTNQTGVLILSTTDAITTFLTNASTDSLLPEHFRNLSSSLVSHSSIPYASLKSIWIQSDPNTRPAFSSLLTGSNFVFSSPKPREKSEELKARLRKLEEIAERKAYNELVKDITPKKAVEEPFSSYKDQLGFGMHIIVTMFTGYLLGYAAFRALFSNSPALNAAGGILGLVGAMLVETLLFIIRSSDQDRRSTPPPVSSIKKTQ